MDSSKRPIGEERTQTAWLLLCFTCSGMSALIYEVAWVRSLELIFGATTFAVATVLAAFMGGLAFGSYFMGRLAQRLGKYHPLRLYAALEIGIGLLALVIPLLFSGLAPLYQAIWKKYHASFALFSTLRFLLCVGILLIPTSFMGATLPLMSQFVNRTSATGYLGRRRIGLLYTVNTVGAVFGCLAAGFLLFPLLGLQKTQYTAIALSTSAAVGAWLLSRRSPWSPAPASAPATPAGPEAPADLPVEPKPAAPFQPRWVAGLLVLIYAISGFSAMMYEVAWSRLLVQVLGSSTYAYTIMLATFLFGLAAGAWMATRWFLRTEEPLWTAGLCQLVVGVTTYLGLFVIEELPFIYTRLHEWWQPQLPGTMALLFLMSFGLMILPTLGLGAMFPVTIHGLQPQGGQTARIVGWAYSLNTVGAIAGSIAAGFWLVPLVGTQTTLLVGVSLNGLMAALAFAAARSGRFIKYRTVFAGLTGLFILNSLLQTPSWDPALMASGVFRYVRKYYGLSREEFRDRVHRIHGEIEFFKEGLTCNVIVFRTAVSMSLLVNGKPDASTPPDLPQPEWARLAQSVGDLPTQIMLGQVPLLTAPQQERVMVIGLGSGVTLGSVLMHPVKEVECVELEDAVVQASQFFNRYNSRPLEDPRVRLIVNDARNHLLVTELKYDVIISEPSNPWIPGAAALFTREFFELARSRLSPQGVFCQWIQLYELQPADLQVILRSLKEVFPCLHMFRVESDAILLATTQPLRFDAATLLQRVTPRVKQDFAHIGMTGAEDMLAHYWIGEDELARAIPGGPLNTDDNMYIEFRAPLRMLMPEAAKEQHLTSYFDAFSSAVNFQIDLQRLPPGERPVFWQRMAEYALLRKRPRDARLYAEQARKEGAGPAALVIQGQALEMLQPEAAAQWWKDTATQHPQTLEVWRGYAQHLLTRTNLEEALQAARHLQTLAPDLPESRYLTGKALALTGRWAEAAEAFGPLLNYPPVYTNQPDMHALAGLTLARLGRDAQALDFLKAALRADYWNLDLRKSYSEVLTRLGRTEEAVLAWQRLGQLRTSRALNQHKEARKAMEEKKWTLAAQILEQAYGLDPWEEDIVFDLAQVNHRLQRYKENIALLERHLLWDKDKAWAVGMLGETFTALGDETNARDMLKRYRVLTGRPWPGISN
ncbi:MAG: fused MFS/spermidine synthase [Verrucomicrobiae bacterium]|nr:fused MFS/spermidine synthase [Verrucomicrobiae bacterium]